MSAEPTGEPQEIVAAVQEVTERAQVLVREEIELAKAEITLKVKKIVNGAIVGAVAGVFALGGVLLFLIGFGWLIWWALPGTVDSQMIFAGFFAFGAFLFVLAGVAALIALRFIKRGSPPTPEMAIEEAQRIKETVQG